MKSKFFNLARKLSYKSDYHSHRLGAVIVCGGDIIGVGFNKRKTHPMSKTRFNNIHAELSAVLNSGLETLHGCDIYIYRETKLGQVALARPCVHCAEMLRQLSISNVYYTTDTGYAQEEL